MGKPYQGTTPKAEVDGNTLEWTSHGYALATRAQETATDRLEMLGAKGKEGKTKNKSSKIGIKACKKLKGKKSKWKTQQKVNIFCWSPPLNSLGKCDNLKPAERKTSEGIVSDHFPGSLTMSSLGGLSWNSWVYVISLNWNWSGRLKVRVQLSSK